MKIKLLLISLVVGACDQVSNVSDDGFHYAMKDQCKEVADNAEFEMAAKKLEQDALITEQPASYVIDRKLIRNGNIEFLTSDVRKTKIEIERIAKEQQGYISAENEDNYDNRLRINQTLRIPADKFDVVMKQLEGLAEKVDSKNISTEDVTEEFIDVDTRLKTKKELEARYLELLKQAKTVADIVSIEGQIANVRAEIESMEGRLKYLSNQVSFSTLNVSYYQESAAGYGFGSKFLNSLRSGWYNLVDFIFWLLRLWPFVIGIIVLMIWWVRRRRSKA